MIKDDRVNNKSDNTPGIEENLDEEQLEALAKAVYERLEQEWNNRAERFHGFMIDTPPWANLPRRKNSAGVGMNVSFGTIDTENMMMDVEKSVSDIENQLDLLAEEIYFMLRMRGERERERAGTYATYWHHQNFW